ncbi:MAG: transposase [Terriglobia bacterium]
MNTEGEPDRRPAGKSAGAVRLRRPERRQMAWVAQCADDLVGAEPPVRRIAEVVEHLDVEGFCAPLKAREGVAGRDATDPKLLVALWLYACVRGIGSARELARQCEENVTFRWLCGGVSVNHRRLSDFRTDHGEALDALFTQVIASLVDQGVVKVSRISQDGVRVRVGAGASSFRREARLQQLLEEAQQHVEELRQHLQAPESAALTARQRGARERAARERQERLQQAIAQLPEVKQRHEQTAQRAGRGRQGEKIRRREPRVSTTDAEARVMKMPNGGFNPAANVQLAADTASRAIVGVEVSKEGSDAAGLSAPMRAQVEQRTGGTVEEHLLDGGYVRYDDIDQAQQQGVALFMAPKGARNPARRGHELDPKPGDSEAVKTWKQRMRSEEGKQIYKQRAATSETVNADLRTHRGLGRLSVRGLAKIRCVALGCALAYNIMHFAKALLA